MPRVTIDLMAAAAAHNAPFYQEVVAQYYQSTRKRHPKFPLIRNDQYGVALVTLPETFDEYFMSLEGSARRNFKKAARSGYTFSRIDYNEFADNVREIWQSAPVRQGEMPGYMLRGEVRPANNPPSNTNVHDYPYFGVLCEGKLRAYAACLVAGEACMIEQIYGHARCQEDGITPMLIISIAEHVMQNCPYVKYITYDNLLGASTNLRRFKRKFGFEAHRVKWVLG
jgi:hypothetical protein